MSDTPTGFDKQRFMDYSVAFRKYFAENEILLSSELWDYLSGSRDTMKQLIEIINSIASPNFMLKYEFLNSSQNKTADKTRYIQLLNEWHLYSEAHLVDNEVSLLQKIGDNKTMTRIFNHQIFKDGEYNVERMIALTSLLN